jgi:hypothetical protein
MARQRTTFRSSQSIAGAVLVGSGMFVLYENLVVSIAWLRHVLGANSSEALGVLPAVILTISQVLQAHAANHQRFLQISFSTCWPPPGRCCSSQLEWHYPGTSSRIMLRRFRREIAHLSI